MEHVRRLKIICINYRGGRLLFSKLTSKRSIARFLSAFVVTNMLTGGVTGSFGKVYAAEETAVFKFDFGNGAVKDGYTQVQSTAAYTADMKYGFTDITKVTAGSTADADTLKGDYLISDGTTFNVDLQPGDYRVNVTFGDTASVSAVDVGVERQFGKDYNGADAYLLNMIKISAAQAAAGEFLEKSFTVSLIDNQLNLDFVGNAAKINGLEIYKLPGRAAGTIPTVYLASDSTVQTYDSYYKPQAGWGQMLNKFFTGDVNIDNKAIGGRSSRSFISEGRLDVILSEIKPGDYLLLQWGHNDATYTRPERYVSETDFPTYIKMYIDGVRQRGATPVLVTPVARRSFDPATGIFNISFGGYRQKMMELSQSMNVPLIDLGLKSKLFLDNFGAEGSKSIFLHVPAGIYGAFPNGSADDTHYQEFGAIQMARLVSEGVKEANLPVSKFVKDITPPSNVPAAPQGLIAGKIASASIAMSWTAAEGADIYYIYRQKSGDTSYSKVGASTLPQFTDVNAAQETTYSYYVTAVNGKGESAQSNILTATTKAPGYRFDFGIPGSPVKEGWLGVPYNLQYTAAKGYGLSVITNDAKAGGRDRGTADTTDDMSRDFILLETDFLVDVPNGDYSVKITVADSTGTATNTLTVEGVSSGKITGKPVGTKMMDVRVLDGQMTIHSAGWLNGIEITSILAAPTGLRSYEKILGETPSVVLAWMPVEGAASYNIYRKSDTDADFIKIDNVSSAGETKYYEQNITLGSSYEYKVTALTADGYESAPTNVEKVVMLDPTAPIPAAPINLRVSAISKNSVTVNWEAVPGAVVYNVYRAKNENGTYVKVGSSKNLQYTDSTVTTNINYYYKVQAVSAGGPSTLSQALKTEVVVSLVRQAAENIVDRSLIAMKTTEGVYLSWRALLKDPQNMSFNVYRDGQRINFAPVSKSTNYVDSAGTIDSTYYVKAVVNEVETEQSNTVTVLANNYFDIKLDKPASGTTPLGETYEYSANDASVGDLDGDGKYELVVKWSPSMAKDNSQYGYTGETILDAYEMDGTRLWRINLGKNIRSGAHYTQFMVIDFDGDGKAEVSCKTADGTVDGKGVIIGDSTVDYRNPSGFVLTGPEYLTMFNGQTGAAIDTVNYKPGRGRVGDWGDEYGNRVDRFLACVAYLNGETPSLVMARGYYTRAVLVAYDFVNGKLVERWTIDSNDPKYAALAGQGNHNLAVADVDGDQMDEIIYGAAAVDNDGTLLYSTGLGHGDAQHLSDLDPARPGYEYYQVHEHYPSSAGMEMRDADSGELIWGVPANIDVGRGVAADVDPRYLGAEAWAIDGEWNSTTGGLYTVQGQKISSNIPSSNFSIYWDGDLLRELLDHSWDGVKGVGKIDEWDYENNRLINLLTAEGTNSNNSTKGNPCLQADLFGDWREEVIWRLADSSALRVFSTTIPTHYKFSTLMQDSVYRLSVAWQNVGYNQPPQVGFYLGDNTTPVNLKVTETGSRSITLDWSDITGGADNYKVYRSTTAEGQYEAVGTPTESFFVDNTVEPTKEYYYKVVSVKDGKESYASLKINTATLFGIVGIKPLVPVEIVEDSAVIDLPDKIEAIGSDGTDVMADVIWDTSTIDMTTPGTYSVKGTVAGFDGGKAELTVVVVANYIKGIKALEPIIVIKGMPLTLPSTVTAQYANGTEQLMPVTWTTIVDTSVLGTNTVEGTVIGFEGKAVVTVNVVENYITSLASPADVRVAEGQTPVIPTTVEATYADGTKAPVAVVWDAVNTSRHGTYTVYGTVEGLETKVTVKVVVYDEQIFKFDMGGVSSKYGNGKVEPGYTEVDAALKYSSGKGYGFTDDSVLSCINRDSASTNKLLTDYAGTWNGFAEFKVDLPNGIYKLKVYSGDLGGSTNTTFTIEGKAYSKISSKNTVNTAEYIVTVLDGVLNIKFGYASGMGAFNGLEITSIPVDSIADTTIKVAIGTNVTLPTTVKATFHDDSVKDLNVTWDNADVLDTNTKGLYILEGTAAETNKKAKAYVYVSEIVQPKTVEFVVGTPITLPAVVTADYGTGSVEVPVIWSGTEALTEIGKYTLTGAVSEYNTTITMSVVIKADYIVSIKELQKIEVIEGLVVVLPSTLTAVYATGKEEILSVTWDTASLPKVPGIYIVEGTVAGFEGKAFVTVVVKQASITGFKELSPIEVIEGQSIVLPSAVTATYNNGTEKAAAVVWPEFSTAKHGTYTLEGTVEGFAGKAALVINVIDQPLFRFDFGGTGTTSGGAAIAVGPVAPGYTEVTKDSLYTEAKGYGFTDISGLNARNHGGSDPVKADFVMPYNAVKEFKVNVPDGAYFVKLTSGALQSGFKTTNSVTLEGSITDSFSTNANVVVKEYLVTVADGVLNLTIGNTNKGAAAINGLVITPMTFDSINPMSAITVSQGEPVELPKTVTAKCHQDGIERAVGVAWNSIDTLVPGIYTVEGTVQDFNGKAQITVEVKGIEMPTATLKVQAGSDGWYTSDIEVTGVFDPKAAINEYSLNGADWNNCNSPILISSEGASTVILRTLNSGGIELVRNSIKVKIDKTAPVYKVYISGNAVEQKAVFDDCNKINFQFSDSLSGLKTAQIEVDGAAYVVEIQKGFLELDMAGKIGIHNVTVTAEDYAGNRLTSNFEFEVTTSIESINTIMDNFIANGQLKGALVSQLRNSLSQAQHQLDKGRKDHAAKHMNDFRKHLNNPALAKNISEAAKTILNSDAEALINLWSK